MTTPPRSVPRPPALLRDVLAWAASPASLPWRGDLVRAGLALTVLGAVGFAPALAVPLTAVVLVAGAYLLLVLAAALGRLDSGMRAPAGLLLGVDALHLFWGAHLTIGIGGPLPVLAATAGVCLLLRIALLPPTTTRDRRRPTVLDLTDQASAAGVAARPCPACPHGRVRGRHGAQRQGLELARAES